MVSRRRRCRVNRTCCKGPRPEVGRLIQAGVESTYRRFLGIVAEARHKSPAEIDRIAQGRVWDGGTARQLGLVDGFGGMEEAIAKAAELAKLGDERGVRYLERSASFKESLLEMIAAEERDDDAAPADALAAFGGARKCSCWWRSRNCARSCQGRGSRCAASNARR